MYLLGLQDILDYNENNHRITAGKGVLGAFFRGYAEQHRELQANVSVAGGFQLGWDSFIALRQAGDGLQIVRIEQRDGNRFADVTGRNLNLLCNPVVTRAVDTCTIIHVHNGDMHYMFHLDEYDDIRANFLTGKLRELGGGEAFVSLTIDNDTHNDRYLNCFAGTGIAFQPFAREVDNYDTFSPGARRPFEGHRDMVNFYGHIEIGLHVQKGRVSLFGDVTNNNRGDLANNPEPNRDRAPCYRFYGLDALDDAIGLLRQDLH